MFFWLHSLFLLPPILTMMLYTYWTPLLITSRPTAYRSPLGGPKDALDGMGSARVVLKSWLRACVTATEIGDLQTLQDSV